MSHFKSKFHAAKKIKTIFAISIITTIAATFMAFGTPAYGFSGLGSGTTLDPYQITTCVQLAEIDDDLEASYLLMNALDCQSAHTRATDQSEVFGGEFNGGGFNIALDIDTGSSDQAALFANVDGALIENVSVSGTIIGNWNSAGIAGYVINAVIQDVSNNADITGGRNVGGIIGTGANTYIENALSTGDIDSATESYVGGIAGYIEDDSQISNSESSSDVTGTSDYVGGLVGYVASSGVSNSTSSGVVNGSANLGGLVGYMESDSEINQSSSSATIIGDAENVGGLIGYSNGVIYESFATGDVTGGDEVGGFVGEQSGEAYDSYARGNVTGLDKVGGFVGYEDCGDNYRSYSTGTVTADGDKGGFIGYEDCGIHSALFWDTETSGISTSDIGTGKTTAEMKNIATFTDLDTVGLDEEWDFAGINNDDLNEEGVWDRDDSINDGYPYLGWQAPEDENLDNDNIDNEVEGDAPNGGDVNNDSVPDNEQSNVASFVNEVSGKYASLVVPDACSIDAVGANNETDFGGTVDDNYSYPSGLMGFSIDCGTPGIAVTIEEYFFETGKTASDFVARKFTPYNNKYQNLDGASLTDVTIGGKAAIKLVFTIQDGGPFDSDQAANGFILDPAGLGSSATTVVAPPSTSAGTLPATGNGAGTGILIATSIVLTISGAAVLLVIKRRKLAS